MAPAKPAGLFKGLLGGGTRKVTAEANDIPIQPRTRAPLQLRSGSQRIKAQAQTSGTGIQRSSGNGAGEGTQRFSLKSLFGGAGARGGTKRIGGRAGGTQVIGGGKGRGKKGPRGLFGGKSGRRDESTVFVAGATGRAGVRIVRQLVQQGLKVRAGVRDVPQAQEYLDIAIAYGLLPKDASRRISLVQCDVTQPETLLPAIGTAAKVVSAIGASDALNLGGPKKIDGEGGINIVKAAQAAGVQHFVMISSLGTGKFGWPAAVLNLFGGVLTQKKRAEEALEASGLRYTIVRPGGLEKPQDDYGETRALVFKQRDEIFGGQVSRLQIAQVVGTCIANSELAENKVLEVVAEESAPRREIELMLGDIEPEASQDSRAAIAEATKDAQEQLDAATGEESLLSQRYQDLQEQLSDMYDTVEDAPNQRAAKKAERDIKKVEAQLEAVREGLENAQTEQDAANAVLKAAGAAAKSRASFSAEQADQIRQDVFDPPSREELQRRRDEAAQVKAEAEEAERAERERVAEEAREARAAELEQRQQEADAKKAEAQQKKAAEEKEIKAAADRKRKEESAAQEQAEAREKKAADKRQQEEDKAKASADAKKQRAAEEKARKEAVDKKREEEASAKAEAAAKDKKAAEDRAAAKRQQEEDKAKASAEAKQQRAADEKARKAAADQKRQDEASAAASAKAKKEKATADERAKKVAAKKQQQETDNTKAQADKVDASVSEARRWIDDWRRGAAQEGSSQAPSEGAIQGSSNDSSSSSNGSGLVEEEKDGGGPFAGFKWPWEQETIFVDDPSSQSQQQDRPKVDTRPRPSVRTMKASGSSESTSGAEDARKWIDSWRSRN